MQILRTSQQRLIGLLLGVSGLVSAAAVENLVVPVRFFVSDSAVYIAGQVISVNGDMF